ncbi:retrovirus-related pol polyprotein from transposon TNT 1-94 [Tanacetum coccineum]
MPWIRLEPDEWIKDSGCSKHMMGNRNIFSTYKAYNGGNVIFGSNLRSNIIGKGTISNDYLKIDNVEHVDNLGFNLLSIGQICDNKCRVTFSEHDSEIIKDGKVIGHANMRLIQSLASKELVRNLPKLKFDQKFYDACKMGKQAHTSHKAKNIVSTTRCLELLHMDLFGPSAVRSYRGNRYTLVIVNDYSRYTWTRFLKDKIEAFNQFEIFSRKIQNQLGFLIVSIRTDHGREFDNEVQFGEFCNANGITHNFSALRTPQSNGVVKRKNRTLQEISRTMLNEQSLPQKFWCNAVDTSAYILNRILIRSILGKTPYELLRGRKPTLDYFRLFGSKCLILNTKDYLTNFYPKSYEGVFLGYSQNSKAYIILNKHIKKIEESLNVIFDETPPPSKTSPLVDDDLDEEEAIRETEKKNLEKVVEDETLEIDEIVKPKNVNEALGDESWIVAMQEELNQFVANDVWELVPQPRNMTIIGTKWVFRNKLDENGVVSRNKARLVAQGYNQQEGIDYDETYAPVARLESIRILLAYACALDFKLFQMDVKSAFLNGFINEEICLGVDLEPDEWIKNNRCSKHMMGNRKLFSTYKAYNKGNIIFGSNLHGNIIGKGQICDNKCRITFFEHDSEIIKDGKVIGYSQNSKAYIILNKHTKKIEESLNVKFDETPLPSKTSPLVDDDLDEEEAIGETKKKNLEKVVKDETLEIDKIVNIKEYRNHPLENVIGNLNQRTLTSQSQNHSNFFRFISTIEPKNVNEALGDESWIVAMQEELNQFVANDV